MIPYFIFGGTFCASIHTTFVPLCTILLASLCPFTPLLAPFYPLHTPLHAPICAPICATCLIDYPYYPIKFQPILVLFHAPLRHPFMVFCTPLCALVHIPPHPFRYAPPHSSVYPSMQLNIPLCIPSTPLCTLYRPSLHTSMHYSNILIC